MIETTIFSSEYWTSHQPDMFNHSNTGQVMFNHSNTGLVRYSDGCCKSQSASRAHQNYEFWFLLTDWFARKNIDDTVIFVTIFFTDTNQAHLITDKFVLLQSGSVFYKRAKQTSAQHKHRLIFTLDGSHRVIY